MKPLPKPSITEVFERVDTTPPCWEWLGEINRDGYGVWRSGGRRYRGHRLVWELLVGPIPDGLVLDHLCRNRPCVNPDHLEPVTIQENIRRGWPARKPACVNGHPYTEENTRRIPDGRRRCKACERARYQRVKESRATAA